MDVKEIKKLFVSEAKNLDRTGRYSLPLRADKRFAEGLVLPDDLKIARRRVELELFPAEVFKNNYLMFVAIMFNKTCSDVWNGSEWLSKTKSPENFLRFPSEVESVDKAPAQPTTTPEQKEADEARASFCRHHLNVRGYGVFHGQKYVYTEGEDSAIVRVSHIREANDKVAIKVDVLLPVSGNTLACEAKVLLGDYHNHFQQVKSKTLPKNSWRLHSLTKPMELYWEKRYDHVKHMPNSAVRAERQYHRNLLLRPVANILRPLVKMQDLEFEGFKTNRAA